MTQDEVKELALNAGFFMNDKGNLTIGQYIITYELEKFAKLVAEKERQVCYILAKNRILGDGSQDKKMGYYLATVDISEDIANRGSQ
jgi:hypothetical protein